MRLYFYKGNLDPLNSKVAVRVACSKQELSQLKKSFRLEMNWLSSVDLPKALTAAHMAALQNGGNHHCSDWNRTGRFILKPINVCKTTSAMIIWFSVNMDLRTTLKFHFPARSRIVAGPCRGVIVAEAKMRS